MKSWTLIVALSSRAFSAGNAANFFLLAQFLQTAQGYGPLAAGLRLLPWTACLFVVAPISGFLVNRVGERPLIVGGLLLQAVGLAWIGLIARPDLAYAGRAADHRWPGAARTARKGHRANTGEGA